MEKVCQGQRGGSRAKLSEEVECAELSRKGAGL
jgi:hypothetical protein